MTVTTPHTISTIDSDSDSEALFKEARRRRRRRWVTSGCLLAVVGLFAGLYVSSGGSPPNRTKAPRRESGGTPATAVVGYPILRSDGIGNARFGQTETIAIGELEAVLGKPLNSTPTNPFGDCAIERQMQWPILTAFFSQGRFVGYGTYSVTGHLLKSNASTAAGLRIGESLIQARVLYRGSLRKSYAQGGSWFVKTPTGTLAGVLTAEVNQTSLKPKIRDITAGYVGCPAASP